jgi:hypothetical protein
MLKDRATRLRGLLRSAKTRATDKFTAGGHERAEQPKAISLPRLKCLEPTCQDEKPSRRT